MLQQSEFVNYQQAVVDDPRPKQPLSIFPKHDPYRFMIAKDEKQITKVYEEGEEIGFMIKGDQSFYELDEDYGYI